MSDDATTGQALQHGVRIKIWAHGPYVVSPGAVLTTRTPVRNAQGEPIDWAAGAERTSSASYVLCRCGHSDNKPFCSGKHKQVGFDGTCTADRAQGSTRRKVYQGAGITMTDDESLCAGYQYCDRHGGVWREIAATADPEVRQRLQEQVANCPSGRLQYMLAGSSAPVEKPYPPTIAAVPDGPLWVLGGVPVEAPDGFVYEVRNRQLLCRCGESNNKPFCDGTHEKIGFDAP